MRVIAALNKSREEKCLIKVGARKDGRRGTEPVSTDNFFKR